MKQKHQSVFLAGLLTLAVGLSACSSMHGDTSGSSGSSGTAGTQGSGGMSGTGGGTGSHGSDSWGGGSSESSGSSATKGQSASAGGMTSTTPNATVAAIEVVPQSSGTATDDTSTGASTGMNSSVGSSSGGSTGSSSADQVYRVTLRMDDGSTQVVLQQTTPDFRTGDRVSLAGGAIQH